MLNSKLRSMFYCILGGALFSVLAPTIALAYTTRLVPYAKDDDTPAIVTVPGETGVGHVASLIGVTVPVEVPAKLRLENPFGVKIDVKNKNIVPCKKAEDPKYQVWRRAIKDERSALGKECYKLLDSLLVAVHQPDSVEVSCAGSSFVDFPVEQGAIYCPRGAITFRNERVEDDDERGHATLIVIETPQEWRLRMGAEAAKDKYEAERMAAMEEEIAKKDAEELKARDAAIAAVSVAKEAEAAKAAATAKAAERERLIDEAARQAAIKELYRRKLVAKQAEYEALRAKEAELAALEARRQESVDRFLEQIGKEPVSEAAAGAAPRVSTPTSPVVAVGGGTTTARGR